MGACTIPDRDARARLHCALSCDKWLAELLDHQTPKSVCICILIYNVPQKIDWGWMCLMRTPKKVIWKKQMETEQIPYFHRRSFEGEIITFWILLLEALGLFDIKHKCYWVRLVATVFKILDSGSWQSRKCIGSSRALTIHAMVLLANLPDWAVDLLSYQPWQPNCPVIRCVSQLICLSCICQERWWCLGDLGSDFNPLTEGLFPRTGRQPSIS